MGLKQSTKRFLSVTAGTVMIVASFVAYFNFIRPAYQEAQVVKTTLIEQRLVAEKQQKAVEVITNLVSKYEDGALQETISLALPFKEDLAGALTQIYGIFLNNNLKVKSLGFSVGSLGSVRTPPRAAAEGTQAAPTRLVKPIGSLRISVSMSGGYEDFKTMLKDLETNIRIFDTTSITFSPPEFRAKQSPPGVESSAEGEGESRGEEEEEVGGKKLLLPAAEEVEQGEYRYGITVLTYYQPL